MGGRVKNTRGEKEGNFFRLSVPSSFNYQKFSFAMTQGRSVLLSFLLRPAEAGMGYSSLLLFPPSGVGGDISSEGRNPPTSLGESPTCVCCLLPLPPLRNIPAPMKTEKSLFGHVCIPSGSFTARSNAASSLEADKGSLEASHADMLKVHALFDLKSKFITVRS